MTFSIKPVTTTDECLDEIFTLGREEGGKRILQFMAAAGRSMLFNVMTLVAHGVINQEDIAKYRKGPDESIEHALYGFMRHPED